MHDKGWQEIVYLRSDSEREEYGKREVERINTSARLFIRPHHLMCIICSYSGGNGELLPSLSNTLYEIWQRICREPDIPVTLVEGCCMACYPCDSFYPPTGRCAALGG